MRQPAASTSRRTRWRIKSVSVLPMRSVIGSIRAAAIAYRARYEVVESTYQPWSSRV